MPRTARARRAFLQGDRADHRCARGNSDVAPLAWPEAAGRSGCGASMNTMVECEHTLLVQADFDGELDAGQAAALVRHVEACAECRAVQEKLVRSRTLMHAVPRYGSSM